MLHVFAGLNLIECDARARQTLPPGFIDLSKTRAGSLASELQTVYEHHSDTHVYLGYLDPILMLSAPDEVLTRRAFRKLAVTAVVSNPLILPYAWKNGLEQLVIVGETKNQDAPPA
jgi:hypothetical protein